MRGPHPRNYISTRGCLGLTPFAPLLQLYKGFDSGRIRQERDDRHPLPRTSSGANYGGVRLRARTSGGGRNLMSYKVCLLVSRQTKRFVRHEIYICYSPRTGKA